MAERAVSNPNGTGMTPSCASDLPNPGASAGAPIARRQHVLGRLVYSQSRAARVLRWTAVALAIAVCLKCLLVLFASLLPPFVYRKDFLQEYTLAKAIAEGIDPYLPTDVLAARFLGALPVPTFSHPTPHPPPTGILLMPLALVGYSAAAAVWLGLELACVVASVYLIGRLLRARLSLGAVLGITALLLTWRPVYTDLILGQLMVPMLALLAGAWLATRSGRAALGGALVGLAVLLKPVPLPLLLVFALRRDWRALWGALTVIVMGYTLAAGLIGFGALEGYATTVLPLVARGYRAHAWNISLWSVGWRVFDGTGSAILAGITAPPLVRSTLAAQVVSIGLPSLLLLAAGKGVRKQRSLDVSLGVMVLVSILTSPISWNHYLVLAVLPGAQVACWLVRRRLPPRQTNLAIVVTMLLIPDWGSFVVFLVRSAHVVDERVISGLTLLTLLPTIAVGALAWLLAHLEPTDASIPTAEAVA